MEKEKYLLEIFVYGKVQGVGFRKYVQKQALKYGIRGFAKNLNNSQVMIHLIFSDREILKKVLKAIQIGPERAKVDKVISEWIEMNLPEDRFLVL